MFIFAMPLLAEQGYNNENCSMR